MCSWCASADAPSCSMFVWWRTISFRERLRRMKSWRYCLAESNSIMLLVLSCYEISVPAYVCENTRHGYIYGSLASYREIKLKTRIFSDWRFSIDRNGSIIAWALTGLSIDAKHCTYIHSFIFLISWSANQNISRTRQREAYSSVVYQFRLIQFICATYEVDVVDSNGWAAFY